MMVVDFLHGEKCYFGFFVVLLIRIAMNDYPDAPTLAEKWLHSMGNVGKYSLHGASGLFFFV